MEAPLAAPPVRVVARLTTDYLLRVVETTIAPMRDVVDGLVFLEVFRSNVEHLPLETWGGAGLGAGEMVAGALRRPVTGSRLAERLGLPHETIRRRVSRLRSIGALQRRRSGLVAPAAALGGSHLQAAMIKQLGDLQKLFFRLAQLGVLEFWDSGR